MSTAKAQAAQVLVARAPTPGTQPTTGWMTVQPNPSGIQNFHPEYIDVRRNVLNPFMTAEKGDHVGQNATPTLVHDLNKGLLDIFGIGFTRSAAKIPGDEGVQIYYPTAATDGGGSQDGFTVGADGDLLNGTIVRARGFRNAANNGVFVLEGTSTTTSIKVPTATLVAETVSPTGSAQVEVTGYQFTSGDLQMDASGNLTTTPSTGKDCTTLGLVDGQPIMIGGSTSGTKLATVPTGTYAYVNGTVTTNLIPLRGHTTIDTTAKTVTAFSPGADDGDGKTVQLFFGVFYRNVADGDPDYIEEPAWWAELRDTGVGTANAAVFSYVKDMVINSVSLAMGVESKIEATLSFTARSITAPVEAADRRSGPASAYPAVSMELFDTSCSDMLVHRLMNAENNSLLIAEVNSCTLTIEHGVTARKQLAACGAAGMIFGNIAPRLEMETFFERRAVPVAIENNTTCRYECVLRNGQAAVFIELPALTLSGGAKTYAENSPVMMTIAAPAHRDTLTNRILSMSVIPYIPI